MKTNWGKWYRIWFWIWVLVVIFTVCKVGIDKYQPALKIEFDSSVQYSRPYKGKLIQDEYETEDAILESIVVPINMLCEFDFHTATSIVAGEAKGEPYEGKLAVAQCIYDSMIYESTDVNGIKFKFDGWEPSLENSNPELWAECMQAVDDVFNQGIRVSDEPLLWFYNRNKMYSSFHESQTHVKTIGSHSFFTANN